MENFTHQDSLKIRDLQMRIAIYDDEKAFNELYILLYDNLVGYVYKMLKSYEYAQEVVSDVFVKLWKIKNQIVNIQNLKMYLYKASKNYCLTYISDRHKIALNVEELPTDTDINSFQANPEEICISNEFAKDVHGAIQKLPDQCRCIFQLVKEECMPYKEVASRLNISAFTVRNQMSIATKKINTHLAYESRKVL